MFLHTTAVRFILFSSLLLCSPLPNNTRLAKNSHDSQEGSASQTHVTLSEESRLLPLVHVVFGVIQPHPDLDGIALANPMEDVLHFKGPRIYFTSLFSVSHSFSLFLRNADTLKKLLTALRWGEKAHTHSDEAATVKVHVMLGSTSKKGRGCSAQCWGLDPTLNKTALPVQMELVFVCAYKHVPPRPLPFVLPESAWTPIYQLTKHSLIGITPGREMDQLTPLCGPKADWGLFKGHSGTVM